jgi:hypothetical protein
LSGTALRPAVSNGSNNACGAIGWQRCGQLDPDAPVHFQMRRDRMEIV